MKRPGNAPKVAIGVTQRVKSNSRQEAKSAKILNSRSRLPLAWSRLFMVVVLAAMAGSSGRAFDLFLLWRIEDDRLELDLVKTRHSHPPAQAGLPAPH